MEKPHVWQGCGEQHPAKDSQGLLSARQETGRILKQGGRRKDLAELWQGNGGMQKIPGCT